MVSRPIHDVARMACGNTWRTCIIFSIIIACLLSACGPGTDADIEYKYFLDFRSEDFYLYNNTYRFTAEKTAADVQSEPEYFRVHIAKATRRFFMIEYVRNGDSAAVYRFDERGRIIEQRENEKIIAWTYEPDKKTAEIRVSGTLVGRNVFTYRDGTLSHMFFYDQKGTLVHTVSMEEEPAAGFLQKDEFRPEPEQEKRYRMEAEEMLELGR